MKGLEESVICFVEFALLSFKSGIRIAVSDEFGLIYPPESPPEYKNGLAAVPVSHSLQH